MDGALQGWVAGLIAAAVTITVTSWLEARTRRRVVLEETLVELAARADMLAMTALVNGSKGPPIETMGVVSTLARAWALAARRAGPFAPRRLAPWRWNLALTLEALTREVNTQIGRAARSEKDAVVDLARTLTAVSAAAVRWQKDPRDFRRGEISAAVLKAASEPRPKSAPTPT